LSEPPANPASAMWDEVRKELEALDPDVMEKHEGLTPRLYHAMNRTLSSISQKIENGHIRPFARLNTLRHSPEPNDPDLKEVKDEIRVGVLPVTGNPLNWGHVLISLMTMDQMNLDTLVFLVHGDIEHKDNTEENGPSTADRHDMVRKVVEQWKPLIRYSDAAIGNSEIGEFNVHEFMKLNPGQKMKVVYLLRLF